MKNSFYILLALLFAGCAQDLELGKSATDADTSSATAPQTRARSLDGAVYNETVDAWMIHKADPYTLANFQVAYDNLATGKSKQPLSKSLSAQFDPARKLSPTHYALKIYPKTEEEQWQVEMMEDVQVAYIPFCYTKLTQTEVKKLPQTQTKVVGMAAARTFTFSEKNPYTVTHDYTYSTDGGPTGPQTFQLPILYTVWPVSKPLPDDLEYVIDYEVFLPNAALDTQLSAATMQILGNEMAARTPGVPPPTFPPPGSLVTYECEGYLTVYDNSLGEDVPIPNLKMSYQVGSSIVNAVPDNTGYFRFVYRDFRMFASDSIVLPITFTYQDPQGKWKITESQTTSAPLTVDKLITFARPSLQHFTGNIKLYMGDRQENAIHRAANYFFNNQTYFPSLYSDALKIIANDATVSSDYAGLFTYGSFGCWINIYHHNHNAGVVIGTTLHELGHFAHFKPLGYSRFINIPKLLQESFASYSGWYLGEEYYVSQGATRPSSGYWTIAGDNHRQYWHENYAPSSILKYYSPLFIDLTDIYNQKTTTTSVYPNDAIQGVPASKIWDIVSVGTTWPLCRSGLQSMVGTYYTSTAFNNWIIQFDNWFNNPANQ